MRMISILNLKGGVGKTSTAVNMAAILAGDYGCRVLLVDADGQCNTTEFYGGDPEKGNLAQLLRHPEYLDVGYAAFIQQTAYPGIDLLAGDDSLMNLDLSTFPMNSARAWALSELVDSISADDAYDVILVDCPPAFNTASTAALVASGEVIIPIKLDAFSLRGMVNLAVQVSNMREINPKLRVAGCLLTMWYPGDSVMEAERILRGGSLPVFQTHIRRTDKMDASTFTQEPLRDGSPRSAAAVDYRRFVREYLGDWLEGRKHSGV